MEIDVTTRALLKTAVLPPGVLLILLAIGWLLARRVAGRLLVLFVLVTLYTLSTPAAVNWLARQIETVPAPTAQQIGDSGADAILVLLAGVRRLNPEYGGADALSSLSLERIDYGLALHRSTGLPIVLSGGSVRGDTTPLAELGAAWLQDRAGISPLATEDSSRDTQENAQHSAVTLRELGLGRVLLVTHAFHMPRALLEIRAAGIDAVPAPFAFMHTPEGVPLATRLRDLLPQPGDLGRSYLILHEMAGLVWHGLRRRT